MVDEKASGKTKAKPVAKKAKPKRRAKVKAKKSARKAKRRGAGRPEIEITAEQRDKVSILIGGGMGIEETAAAMNMAPNTFKKHFKAEIKLARSGKRAEVLMAMFKSAIGGNVSAQKQYIALNALADADDAALNPPVEAGARAPAPRAAKVLKGKKEIAQEEAATAVQSAEWGNDLDVTAPVGAKPN
jgi:hypothetical protein